MQVPEGGYVLDANGNPVKSTYVPNIGDILDRYGAPNGTYTAPVINGKTFDYVERALPYVEDISKYHQYKVVGDFSNIQDYIQNCEDLILKTKIEAAILTYHGGNYSKLTTYIGDIAPGFGTSKGGVQIQLPLTVEQLQGIGILEEIF